jgi:hypothetical protein
MEFIAEYSIDLKIDLKSGEGGRMSALYVTPPGLTNPLAPSSALMHDLHLFHQRLSN